MAEFVCSGIKKIAPGEKVFKIMTEEDEKNLKGYQFDSLVYRYILARKQMAQYEYEKDHKREYDWITYERRANRDILRFIQILDEVIGEHN